MNMDLRISKEAEDVTGTTLSHAGSLPSLTSETTLRKIESTSSLHTIGHTGSFLALNDVKSCAFENPANIPSEPGISGLHNLGNTCFMNAGLQCLLSNPHLIEHILDNVAATSSTNAGTGIVDLDTIAVQFACVLHKVWSGKHATIRPTELKKTLGMCYPQFKDFRQHDAQEFIALFLDSLHEHLNDANMRTLCSSSSSKHAESTASSCRSDQQNNKSVLSVEQSESSKSTTADIKQEVNDIKSTCVCDGVDDAMDTVMHSDDVSSDMSDDVVIVMCDDDASTVDKTAAASSSSSELTQSTSDEQQQKVGKECENDKGEDIRLPSLADLYMKDNKTLNTNVLAEEEELDITTDSDKFHKTDNHTKHQQEEQLSNDQELPYEQQLQDFLSSAAKGGLVKPPDEMNLMDKALEEDKFGQANGCSTADKVLFSDMSACGGSTSKTLLSDDMTASCSGQSEKALLTDACSGRSGKVLYSDMNGCSSQKKCLFSDMARDEEYLNEVPGEKQQEMDNINNIKRMKIDEDSKNARMQHRLKINTNKNLIQQGGHGAEVMMVSEGAVSPGAVGISGRGVGQGVNITGVDTTLWAAMTLEADREWQNYLAKNRSIIVDTFQGQFKSTVVCSECQYVSVTYEPFMYLSVPLPHAMDRQLAVTFVPSDGKPAVRYLVTVHKMSYLKELREKLLQMIGQDSCELTLAEVFDNHISRILEDNTMLRYVNDTSRVIYAFEMLPAPVIDDETDTNSMIVDEDVLSLQSTDAANTDAATTAASTTTAAAANNANVANSITDALFVHTTAPANNAATVADSTPCNNEMDCSYDTWPSLSSPNNAGLTTIMNNLSSDDDNKAGALTSARVTTNSHNSSFTMINNKTDVTTIAEGDVGVDGNSEPAVVNNLIDLSDSSQITPTLEKPGPEKSSDTTTTMDQTVLTNNTTSIATSTTTTTATDMSCIGVGDLGLLDTESAWKSCAICLEEMLESALMIHPACEGTLCHSCLEMSFKHFGDILLCPVCNTKVDPVTDFIQLSNIVGHKAKTRIVLVPVVQRIDTYDSTSPSNRPTMKLIGHPNILQLTSNIDAQTLYDTVDKILPTNESYTLLFTDGQGYHCSRCLYTASCTGCEAPREGNIQLQPNDNIAVRYNIQSTATATDTAACAELQNSDGGDSSSSSAADSPQQSPPTAGAAAVGDGTSSAGVGVLRAAVDQTTDHSSMAELRDQQPLTIYDCFQAFTESEKLDEHNPWYCPRCKSNQCAQKTISVWRYPKILVVYLKRFVFHDLLSSKIDSQVIYPLTDLDISRFISGPRDQCLSYDLQSCVCHFGGVNSGHYTAYAKHPQTDQWHYYNDETVTPKQPQEEDYKNAYVLFYHRKGMDAGFTVPPVSSCSACTNAEDKH